MEIEFDRLLDALECAETERETDDEFRDRIDCLATEAERRWELEEDR